MLSFAGCFEHIRHFTLIYSPTWEHSFASSKIKRRRQTDRPPESSLVPRCNVQRPKIIEHFQVIIIFLDEEQTLFVCLFTTGGRDGSRTCELETVHDPMQGRLDSLVTPLRIQGRFFCLSHNWPKNRKGLSCGIAWSSASQDLAHSTDRGAYHCTPVS